MTNRTSVLIKKTSQVRQKVIRMKPLGWILALLITGMVLGVWQKPGLSHYQDEKTLSIRAQGMGGILPLPVQDPSVTLFNPAGLGWLEGVGLSLPLYISHDSTSLNLNTALNIGPLGIRWTRNEISTTCNIGYGFRPAPWFSWGLSLNLDARNGPVDFGVIISPRPWLDIGISQSSSLYGDGERQEKWIVSLSNRWRESGNVLVLAGILEEKGPELRIGLEHQISNRTALRVGYRIDHFTLGATVHLFSGFDLDYAAELEQNDEPTHYLGLTFGRPRHGFYRNDLHRVAEKAKFGEDRFALLDGHNLHYVESGKGRPLILITPFSATYRIWDPMISSLSRHHLVLAIELLGGGDSDKPSFGFDYTPKRHAALVKELMIKLGIEKTDLVGLSYAGTVALEFAKNYPDLTKKVVVIEGSLDPQTMMRQQQLLYTLRSKPVVGDLFTGLARSGVLNGPLTRLVMGGSYAKMTDGEREIAREIVHWSTVNTTRIFWQKLASIDPRELMVEYDESPIESPILFLIGDDSQFEENLLTTLEVLESKTSDLEVVRISKANHLLHLQYPEVCSRLILQFLSDH